MRKISSCFLFFLFTCLHALAFDLEDFQKQFKLLPQPQKIELSNGKGISAASLHSLYLNGIDKPVLYGSLQSLPLANQTGEGVLELKLSPDNNRTEGYTLEVKDE